MPDLPNEPHLTWLVAYCQTLISIDVRRLGHDLAESYLFGEGKDLDSCSPRFDP